MVDLWPAFVDGSWVWSDLVDPKEEQVAIDLGYLERSETHFAVRLTGSGHMWIRREKARAEMAEAVARFDRSVRGIE